MTVTTNQNRADAFKILSAAESRFNASVVHRAVLILFLLVRKIELNAPDCACPDGGAVLL
jgi:hypothetical protein